MRKNFGVKTYLYPMPVLIIGTYDEEGNADLMNAAWGGISDFDKITIALSGHQTTDNILKNKAFTVSVGDKAHVTECDYVGIVSKKKEPRKMEKSGFRLERAEYVNAPVPVDLPMTLECEFISYENEFISYENEVMTGKIVNVSCDERYLGEDGLPDLRKFTPITYDPVHMGYYALGERVADAFQCGNKLK